jgi:S-adenosylmethionine:tRNA ribosyltransferase-isomerase
MRTQMHQEAFPGEDISDRPPPEDSVPGPRAQRRHRMSALAFELPGALEALEAREPAEARGLARDGVRLMVASASDGRIEHATFSDLPRFLAPGDLLVINTSATIPAAAAVAARRPDGTEVRVHFATRAPHLPQPWFVVELRSSDGSRPIPGSCCAERLALTGGGTVELVTPYASGNRLVLSRVQTDGPLLEYLDRFGEPIRYGHMSGAWPRSRPIRRHMQTLPGAPRCRAPSGRSHRS